MLDFYTNVRQHGNKLLVSGWKKGKRFREKINYKPSLYIPTTTDTVWRTLDQKPVAPVKFDSINELKSFTDQYKGVSNFDIFGDISPTYMFISEFGNGNNYESKKIRIANIDIEVGSENGFPDPKLANEEFTAITIYFNGKYHVWGIGDYTPHIDNVIYYYCSSEEILIHKFLNWWEDADIDIVTGWNVEFFDIPYIYNRIEKILGEKDAKRLSPFKVAYKKIVNSTGIYNKEQTKIDIYGISVLDYMELYKKLTFTTPESYKLEDVAEYELGERKIDYSEYQNLHQLYKSDYQKYIEYNIKDVELVKKLDDKNQLLSLVQTMAYEFNVNYEDTSSQIRMWDSYLYDHLKSLNIVIPKKKSRPKESFPGGYVMDPIVGGYDWIMSFDLNSLYPHIMMGTNISPETLRTDIEPVDHIINVNTLDDIIENGLPDSVKQTLGMYDVSLAANGYFYDKSKQGFIPKLLEKLYTERKEYKRLMIEAEVALEIETDPLKINILKSNVSKYSNYQLVKKVGLNSIYGASGNRFFRYYDIRNASAVTSQGQMAIKWIGKKLNSYLKKYLQTEKDVLIYSDTDSVYFSFESLVEKYKKTKPNATRDDIVNMLDSYARKVIEPFIDEKYQELAETFNHFQQKMVMKREIISNRAIWTGKKRYIMNVLDSEGVRYKTPKLKVIGMEMVRSSTPKNVRVKLKTATNIILSGTEADLQKFIRDYKKEFKQLPVSEIAFPRGINGLNKFINSNGGFIKGTPVQVRAAGTWNKMLKDMSLDKTYETIKEGEKAKFIYLKLPNPVLQNVIAFVGDMPDESKVKDYIDYETQFEKSVVIPIATILNAIGWQTEPIASLESFFQ